MVEYQIIYLHKKHNKISWRQARVYLLKKNWHLNKAGEQLVMTTDRKYDADMFPYLMSDVENVIFEKSDLLHERSGLLRSIEVKPRNYCGKSTVMIAMVTASSSSMDKKLKKGDIRFFIYLMLYVSYLILGSLAFRSMELETEIDLKNNFRDARERFQQKYSNVIGI